MKLLYHLLCIVIPSIILSIGLVTIFLYISLVQNLDSWINQIGDSLQDAETTNLKHRISNLKKLNENIISQINADVSFLEEYAIRIFSGQYQDTNHYYPSYNTLSIDPRVPSSNIDASSYYQNKSGVSVYMNRSSLLDDPFRAIFFSNQQYSLIYVGFKDGFFRRFPWSRSDHLPTLRYICSANNKEVVGYDPVCRSWYQLAKNNPNNVVLTPPYAFASNGEVAITAAKAIVVNNELIGVIGADISMDYVLKIISQKILNRGYSFIVDNSGHLIFYPDLKRDKIYTIQELEGITINGSVNTFSSYQKNGEDWLIIFSNIEYTNFSVCIVVPADDVQEYKLYMNADSDQAIQNAVIIAGSVLGSLTIIWLLMIGCLVIIITKPIKQLTRFLDETIKQNNDPEKGDPGSVGEDLKRLQNSLETLSLIKIGNEAFERRDYVGAMKKFCKAEQIIKQRSNNIRALGIVYANKANTMRLRGDNEYDTEVAYKMSIEAAQMLIEEVENKILEYTMMENNLKLAKQKAKKKNKKQKQFEDNLDKIVKEAKTDRIRLKIDLGNRLMNLGVFYMETKNFVLSLDFFNRALAVHRESDNGYGISKTLANKAQLYGTFNLYDDAFVHLAMVIEGESRRSEKGKHSQKVLQYSYMNYGLLKLGQNKNDEAAEYFWKALKSAKSLDVNVMETCVSKLRQYYLDKGIDEADCQAKKIIETYDTLFKNNFRQINFVLDVSGSMYDKIFQCLANIKDIVQNKLDKKDLVSLYTFSDEVHSVFQCLRIQENRQIILEKIDTCAKILGGNTAFYNALLTSMMDCKAKNDKTWIIALTDGEDNVSDPETLNEIYKNSTSNIIIISVGELKNERVIQTICNEAMKNGQISFHIKASENSLEEIDKAFLKVGKILASIVIMEDI